MEADNERLTELVDREAIKDCIYRYCRGIDRADEASLRGSYWPDATDCHGSYSGPVEGFFRRARALFETRARSIHHVGNILIEFKGDSMAVVESYFLALQRGYGPNGLMCQFLLAGRYCDLFEKRGGEWRVARRIITYDWVDEQPVPEKSEGSRFGARRPIGANFPNDPIYQLLAGSD
jgi:SnoaL-like domain